MEQAPTQLQAPSEPPVPVTLEDVGTRYVHLREFLDTIEAGVVVLGNIDKGRGMTKVEKEKYVKLLVTYEIVNTLVDSMSKYKGDAQQYRMSRIVDQIPAAKDMEGYIPA